MKAIILCSALLFFSVNCMAASYVYNVDIVKIHTYDDYVVVRYSPETPNSENCTHTEKNDEYFVVDYTTSSHSDNVHATLLSAFLAGKKINMALSGCYTWDGATIPKAYRVDLFSDQ